MMAFMNTMLSLLLLTDLGLAQMVPLCSPPSSVSTTPCVMTYYRWMAEQTPPTSTIYGTIVTTVINNVDCGLCSITAVNRNAVKPNGFQGSPTHVPTLTVTEVGCMPETATITRRDIRGAKLDMPATKFNHAVHRNAVDDGGKVKQNPTRRHKRSPAPAMPYHLRSLMNRQSNSTAWANSTAWSSPTAWSNSSTWANSTGWTNSTVFSNSTNSFNTTGFTNSTSSFNSTGVTNSTISLNSTSPTGITSPLNSTGGDNSTGSTNPSNVGSFGSSNPNPPSPYGLSSTALVLLSQVISAEYAIEIINSGFNLANACLNFQNASNWPGEQMVGLIPTNVADIVCFASVYGIDLNRTNAGLLEEFSETIYAIELASDFANTTNTTELCKSIDFEAYPDLGIDAAAIYSYICGAEPSTVVVSSTTTVTVGVVPVTGVVSGSLTTVSWGSAATSTMSGIVGPGSDANPYGATVTSWAGYGNGTYPWASGTGLANGSSNATVGGAGVNSTAATGNAFAFSNATHPAPTGADETGDSVNTGSEAVVNIHHLPRDPADSGFFPAVTPATTSASYAGY